MEKAHFCEDAEPFAICLARLSILFARSIRCLIELAQDTNITPRQITNSWAAQILAPIQVCRRTIRAISGTIISVPPKIYSSTHTIALSLNIIVSSISNLSNCQFMETHCSCSSRFSLPASLYPGREVRTYPIRESGQGRGNLNLPIVNNQ